MFEHLMSVLNHLDGKVNTTTLLLIMNQINMMGLVSALPEAYKQGGNATKTLNESLPMLLPLLSGLTDQNSKAKDQRRPKRR